VMLKGRRDTGGGEFRLRYPGHPQVPSRRGPLSLSLPLGITNLNSLALIRGCIPRYRLHAGGSAVEFQLHCLTGQESGSRENGREFMGPSVHTL
jgi:hypothetical protein